MNSMLRVALLCLLSLGHLWAIGVLLLTRQTDVLLFFLPATAGCWLYWCWNSLRRQQRALCVLAGLNLLLALTVGMLCLWDTLDASSIPLLEKIF